jgi:hypothetical protein
MSNIMKHTYQNVQDETKTTMTFKKKSAEKLEFAKHFFVFFSSSSKKFGHNCEFARFLEHATFCTLSVKKKNNAKYVRMEFLMPLLYDLLCAICLYDIIAQVSNYHCNRGVEVK